MAGKQRTKRVFVAALVMTWVVLTLVARTVLAWWGFSGAASTSLAVVICLPQLLGSLAYARVNWAATYPHPVSLWGVAAVWAVSPGVAAAAAAARLLGLDPRFAAIVGVVVGSAFVGRFHRLLDAGTLLQVQRPLQPRELGQEERLIRDCRRVLRDPAVTGDRRAAATINLARALTQQSSLTTSSQRLDEAVRLLQQVFHEPPRERWLLVDAAQELTQAMSAKAQHTDDLDGYRQAVELQLQAAELAPSNSVALARAHLDAADYHLRCAGMADDPVADRHADEALGSLREALRATEPSSPLAAEAHIRLSGLLGHPDGDLPAIEEAIDHARVAQRLMARWPVQHRVQLNLTLASVLTERAMWGPPTAEADLREAEALCREVIQGTDPALSGLAWETLAGALQEPPDRVGDDEIARAYRQALQTTRLLSLTSAARVAANWVDWAVRGERVQLAADAYWHSVSIIPEEIQRRVFRPDRERLAGGWQGLAAEAGYWLIEAKRARDAAVAVELGRALLLSNVVQRERLTVQRLVDDATTARLSARFAAASARLDEEERAQYLNDRPAAPGPPIVMEGRSYKGRFTSGLEQARAEYDDVVRELSQVAGFEDLLQRPRYADLQAAAVTGPLVYLAAAEAGGFALIVTREHDPQVVRLPDLTADALAVQARNYMVRASADSRSELGAPQDALTWLWTAVMGPLVEALPAGSLVTLIPAGALGLLPLHAAETGGRGGALRYAADHLVIRYAPNARVLARAEALTAEVPVPYRVLAIDVPEAEGLPRLSYSTAESRRVSVLFGDDHSTVLPEASREEVLRSLDGHSVWHFACHGHADVDRPLDSALLLADGRVALRDLIARPAGRQRLAVLSACETNVPDLDLLDEVVTLPSGLLQIGVAGVIATQWKVADRAAVYLVLRFYEEWLNGAAPVRAFATAQSWLRTSTHAELQAHQPGLYPEPGNKEGWLAHRPFQHPEVWAAFSYTGA